MKKRILSVCLVMMMFCLSLTGCGETSESMNGTNDDGVELSFTAEFFDNSGSKWLEVEGSDFDLVPNKVKEYGYNSEGSYTSWYETSSIITCYIDGMQVDTCGSTAIFKDKRIEPCDIDFSSLSSNIVDDSGELEGQDGLSVEAWWRIRFWWDTQISNGKVPEGRLVIIQSQEGNPITMYMGEEVSWEISRLPKTTHIVIDGKDLYLHRANFAVIDTKLLPSN